MHKELHVYRSELILNLSSHPSPWNAASNLRQKQFPLPSSPSHIADDKGERRVYSSVKASTEVKMH